MFGSAASYNDRTTIATEDMISHRKQTTKLHPTCYGQGIRCITIIYEAINGMGVVREGLRGGTCHCDLYKLFYHVFAFIISIHHLH